MGERTLTVREMIIVHLSAYNRYADEFECPEDMCQSGISVAVGKSRAHITLELGRMKDAILVYDKNARIKGARSKRKAYLLTPDGLARNSEIIEHINSLKMNIAGDGASKAMSGIDAVDLLRMKFGMSRVDAVSRVIASGGSLDVKEFENAMSCENADPRMPPRPENFLPRKELDDIITILGSEKPNTVMLLGIPGMGKTAILSQLAWTINPEVNVMYRRLYPFDSPSTVINTLSEFMKSNGHLGLARLLVNPQAIDCQEAGTHISEFFRQCKVMLMFDDFEKAPPILEPFFGLLMELVKGTGSCMLISSARKGDFYSLINTSLQHDIREIHLAPMGRECSLKLLGPNNDQSIDGKLKIAAGHPLTLRLLAEGLPPCSLAGYVEDEILGKDSGLSKLCRFAAVLRRPFMPGELELFGFHNASEIRNCLAFEAQPGGGYLLHSAISSIMLAATGKPMLRDVHSKAAEFYQKINSDVHEALHHLIEADQMRGAKELLLANTGALIDSRNIEELASMIGKIIRYDDSIDMMEIASAVMDRAGKWDTAVGLAAQIERMAPGTRPAARSCILRANILAKTGHLGDAMSALESIQITSKDGNIMSKAHHAKACVLRRMDRNREALKVCEQAMNMAEKCGDKSLHTQCRMEMAMIMTTMGEHPKALEFLEGARDGFKEFGSASDAIRCDINMGMALRECGREGEAIILLEDAVKSSENAGLNRLKAHAMANLSDLMTRGGEFERSAIMAESARKIFSGLGEPLMLAAATINLSLALAGSGQKERAISAMKEGVAVLRANNLLETRKSWLIECADMLRKNGEKKMAAELRNMCAEAA